MKQTLPSETMQMPEKTRQNYPLYAFFVLLTVTILNELDNSVFSSASTRIARDLHLGINDIGFLSSAFTLAVTLSIIPVGIWADRAKRKHVIAACLAVWSLATTSTALASNFLALFLVRTVVGGGEAGYAPTSNALVGDLFGVASRAKVLSWLAVGRVVGTVLGLIIGGIVAGLYSGSWRLAFLITGIPGLLLVLAVWHLPEPAHQPVSKQHPSTLDLRKVFSHFWTLLGIKTLAVLLVMGILEAFALSSLTAYISPLLQQKDTFGLNSGQAGLFAGLGLAIAGVPGVLLGGYLADWLNRRYPGARLLICGLSLLVAAPLSLAMILVANTHNFSLFTALFLGTLFADSAHAGSLAAARLDVVPVLMRGSAVAIAILLNRILGSGLAPTIVGLLARSFDPGGQHFLHALAGHDLVLALAWICPLAFLVAGLDALVGLRWVRSDRMRAERTDATL